MYSGLRFVVMINSTNKLLPQNNKMKNCAVILSCFSQGRNTSVIEAYIHLLKLFQWIHVSFFLKKMCIHSNHLASL